MAKKLTKAEKTDGSLDRRLIIGPFGEKLQLQYQLVEFNKGIKSP